MISKVLFCPGCYAAAEHLKYLGSSKGDHGETVLNYLCLSCGEIIEDRLEIKIHFVFTNPTSKRIRRKCGEVERAHRQMVMQAMKGLPALLSCRPRFCGACSGRNICPVNNDKLVGRFNLLDKIVS